MAAYDELKLSVTLIDGASPGLEKIRQEVAALGESGKHFKLVSQHTANLEQTLRKVLGEFGQLGRAFNPIAFQVTNFATKLLPFAGNVAAVTTSVLGLGFAFKAMVDNASQFAKQMVALKDISRATGVDPADFEKMSKAFQRAGVSAEEASRTIAGLANAQADLTRNNNQLLHTLIAKAGADEKQQQEMKRLIDLAAKGDTAGFGEAIKAISESIRRIKKDQLLNDPNFRMGDAAAEAGAAAAQENFLREFNATALARLKEKLESATAEEKKAADARMEAGVKFAKVSADIADSWDEISKAMSMSLMPQLIEILISIAGGMESIADSFERRGKQSVEGFNKKRAAEARGSDLVNWWRGGSAKSATADKPAGLLDTGGSGSVGPASADSMAKEAQTSAEVSKMLQDFARNEKAGPEMELAATGTRGGEFGFGEDSAEYERLGRLRYEYRGDEEYGVGSDATKTVRDLAAEMKRLADDLEAMTGLGTSGYGALSTGVSMRGLGGLPGMGGDRGGGTSFDGGTRGGAAEPESRGDARPFESGGDARSTATTGSSTSSAGSPVPGDGEIGPAAAVALARKHLGENESKDERKLAEFFRSQNIKISPKTTAWCAAFINTTLAASGVQGTGTAKNPSLAAYSFLKWGNAVSDKAPIQAGDVAIPKGYSHVQMLTGETQMRNGVEYVKVIGGNQGGKKAGGGEVSEYWVPRASLRAIRRADETMIAKRQDINRDVAKTAAPPQPAASPTAQTDRSQVDQDMSRPVQANGTVNVDVNAPKGTRVTAESDGMFNQTQVNRTMPMETDMAGPG